VTSGKVATTVGYERRYSVSLRFTDRDLFVEHMLADQPPRPANMVNIIAINQGKRPYTGGWPRIPSIAPEDAATLIASGHAVVDVRSHEAYGAGHVPGACNVQLSSSSFEQTLGWILPDERPFVLVGDTADQAGTAATKLAFVGLDRRATAFVAFREWTRADLPVADLPQIGVEDLVRELRAGGVRVLDVRDRTEWESGHIESAIHANFKHLSQIGDRLPVTPDEPVAVVCAGGMRSSTACGLLRERGFRRVLNVHGGMDAWIAAGLPVELV
jgi:hydroxyacylglutathione hydrolase